MTVPTFSLDIETSSAADLRKVGAYAYTAHPSTWALMLAYHPVGDAAPPRLWRAGDPVPAELVEHIRSGGFIAGWNVTFFDRLIYDQIIAPRFGFPAIPADNWRDSAQLAAAANLPRSLDGCARAVGVGYTADLKDSNRIRRITDANRTPIPALTAAILDSPGQHSEKLVADMTWLASRCVQDVVMEEQVLIRLPPWPGVQPWLAMPAIDRRINDRGILIDVALVQGLAKAAGEEIARLDNEMARLTGDVVSRTSNIGALKEWLVGRGVPVPRIDEQEQLPAGEDSDEDEDESSPSSTKSPWRLRKNDIANLLVRPDLPEDCRQALYMRAEAAKASVRKLTAMAAAASPDGRLRGMLVLMGAQATGRFSSGRAQVHNLVRDAFAKDYETIAEQNGLHAKKDKIIVKQISTRMLSRAIKVGRSGDPALIRCLYEGVRKDLQGRARVEGVLPWISRMMRRTICAREGHLLLNGDFANIEARIPVWLAAQQETVDAFARGEDLYRVAASPVYGIPPEQLSSEQRQIGKVMRLFLGFAAGVNAFIPAAMNYGLAIPHEDAARYVQIFRETNGPLVAYWDANLQAAVAAVQNPGRAFSVPPTNLVTWFTYGDCLCVQLPSGRLLRYWQPRLQQTYWSDGSPKATLELTVLVVKGRAVFRRSLWRGLAIENLVQAIAADMLGVALENMEEAGLPVVLHVHDSVAAEVEEDRAEALLPVFRQAMLSQRSWTAGLPVAVDTEISARFG